MSPADPTGSAAAAQLEAVLAHIDAHLDESLDRLYALLRIPSISTDPAYRDACREAAMLVKGHLDGLGLQAELCDTPEVPDGHPLVLAHGPREAGRRHALFYGHYDVQPVDPLELWEHDPFKPQLITRADGAKEIRARGASDDKGQIFTFFEAVRAWTAVAGRPPIDLSVLIEGEEESGGPSMAPFLAKRGAELKADLALVCDTGLWGEDRPAITMSLRGSVGGQVSLKAADRDLHSGLYGGAARNPLALLASILADLRDETGRVTLAGFYDGVAETPETIRADWATLDSDGSALLAPVGLSAPAGEAGRSVLEQVWARPTAEINGLWGGYIGEGFKTVIPAEAHAKISFRLVGAQDPTAVWKAFEAHVRARLPEDCEARFLVKDGGGAVTTPYDLPEVVASAAALEAEWGKPTALIGGGGSIPVVETLQTQLGQPTLLIGFARDDDRIHAPNEKYDLKNFRHGVRSWARILLALAEAR